MAGLTIAFVDVDESPFHLEQVDSTTLDNQTLFVHHYHHNCDQPMQKGTDGVRDTLKSLIGNTKVRHGLNCNCYIQFAIDAPDLDLFQHLDLDLFNAKHVSSNSAVLNRYKRESFPKLKSIDNRWSEYNNPLWGVDLIKKMTVDCEPIEFLKSSCFVVSPKLFHYELPIILLPDDLKQINLNLKIWAPIDETPRCYEESLDYFLEKLPGNLFYANLPVDDIERARLPCATVHVRLIMWTKEETTSEQQEEFCECVRKAAQSTKLFSQCEVAVSSEFKNCRGHNYLNLTDGDEGDYLQCSGGVWWL